jgi:alpha-1,2-mannosyltransferase
VLTAASLVVFSLSAHWWWPNTANREQGWSFWQQLAGNSYPILALIVLLVIAIRPSAPASARFLAGGVKSDEFTPPERSLQA